MQKNVILSLLIIAVTTKCLVEGLQCYVCEDCNEYEDFKELHICGEIPVETTITPNQLESSSATNPTLKPPAKPGLTEDYLDSEETHDEVRPQNSTKKTTTKEIITPKPTTEDIKTIAQTTSKITSTITEKPATEESSTATEESSTAIEESSTTTTKSTTTESKTTSSATAVSNKPIVATDYDDYLEYEELSAEKRSAHSLLKINEPVCYMIKFQVNNTVITNRGCTTFINANKYLTCQSLYNGAPMESCRVCSSNGCNKFLSDDGDEDNHGLPINTASSLEKLSFVVLLLGSLVKQFLI